MKILYNNIKQYKGYLFLALVLASINICFSLSDSIITGKAINNVAIKIATFKDTSEFMKAIIPWLLLSIGAAMISRIAKNFQDYFTNIIIQRVGANMYTNGIKKALELPYQDFEDQRSGETLGKLQKVKTDSEKFITLAISLVFQSIVGIGFVMFYVSQFDWKLSLLFLATVPVIGVISSFLGKKIKIISKQIFGETTALAGATTESLRNIELVKSLGLTNQEVDRLNTATIKILLLCIQKNNITRRFNYLNVLLLLYF